MRQQAEVLEDHGELGAPQLTQLLVIGLEDVLTLDDHLACSGIDQTGEAAHERGLSRAGQAHDDKDLALGYVEGHIAHGRSAARVGE